MNRQIIIYGAIFCVLAAVVWATGGRWGGETALPATPTTQTLLIPALDPNQISRLDVWHLTTNDPISFDSADGRWIQTIPTTQMAGDAVGAPVSRLLGLTSHQTFNVFPDQLAGYGLESPNYRITLAEQTADGRTVLHTLLIGDTTPTGDLYALAEGDNGRVHVIEQSALAGTLRLLLDFGP